MEKNPPPVGSLNRRTEEKHTAILNPERVKRWENVRAAIEQLEDLFRRYENRKNEAGERERLSEDIKATSLELLVPSDIERHLLLNKGRLTTYAQMKSEIDLVMESSWEVRHRFHALAQHPHRTVVRRLWTWTPSQRSSTAWSKARGPVERAKVRAKVKTRAVAEKVQLPRT